MSDNIVKIHTLERDGYLSQQIVGLNIFQANDVEFEMDPRLIFMRTLADEYACDAQIGWESISGTTARTPEEYCEGNFTWVRFIDSTTPVIGNHNYEFIPIGLYGGGFWYAENEWEFSCWVPRISADDLTSESSEYTSEDSLVLYVNGYKGGMPFNPHIAYPSISKTEFEAYWIKYSLQSFDLVCTTQYDGYWFEVHAESESSFAMLQRGLSLAVNAIESSDWYRANSDNLYWDDHDACLKLKE